MIRQATKFPPSSRAPFELATNAGFRNAEFWLNDQLLVRWRDVVALARDYPMRYAMHFPNRGSLSDELLDNAVQMYRAIDCSALVIHQPMFDKYGQQLLQLDPTMRLAIENHDLSTESQLSDWARRSPWLTLDVEHLWIYTLHDAPLKQLRSCLRKFLQDYGHKLAHVHLPGYLPGQKVHRPQYCSRMMVMRVFSLLQEIEFDGLVVSETAEKFQNAEELQMDTLLYRRWCIEQGINPNANNKICETKSETHASIQ